MSDLKLALKKKVQYTLRDIKNMASRVTYKPAPMNEDQQKALADLKENGFTMIPAEKVFTPEQWNALEKEVDSFLSHEKTKQHKEAYYKAGKTEYAGYDNKTFLIRASDVNMDLLRNSAMTSLAHNTFIHPLVDNYYGLPTKIVFMNYWYNLKTFDPESDVYSQAWHADPEGDRIVKVFIYFTDVDERSGALQYVKGSQKGGKNAAAMSAAPRNKSYYPDKAFVEANFPKDDIISAKAKRGTVVICDTRGLHRGGKCLDNERVVGVLEFLDKGSFAVNVAAN